MSHIEEVANRLKGLRDALGLTIAEMASACSVDEELYRDSRLIPSFTSVRRKILRQGFNY